MISGVISVVFVLGSLGGDSSAAVCSEHPDRVKALFAALDLNRAGLETVKKDVESGDLPRACDDLLAYYRNGSSGEWLRRPAPKPGEGRVPEADAILDDTFTLYSVASKVPRLPNGNLDWNYNGPENDKEWGWGLNRHQWARTLFDAFSNTGNPEYAKRLNDLLYDWVVSNPYPGVQSATPPWRGLEAFLRGGGAWPVVFYGMQQSELLAPATRILMLSSIPDHAHYARNFHKPTGNWITMELLGLATEAVCWPEFKDADRWYEYAVTRIVPEMSAQVYPDGVQKELTEHYHRDAMSCFQGIVDIAGRAGRSVPAEFSAGIERMHNYIAYSMEPNGYAPLNNDSDYDYVRDEVRAAGNASNRRDWLYISSNGTEGDAPAGLPSIVFPWAGQAVMRSGWDADAQWAFFDAGPMGIAHYHHDKLHLSVSAFGRDILVDSGRYSYVRGPWREYFTLSGGHNVILVDGKGQVQCEKEAVGPIDGAYKLTPEYDFVRGDYTGGYRDVKGTVTHSRAVLYLRGRYFVVVDRVATDRPRTIQALWHFHPACTVGIEGSEVASSDAEQGNVRVIPIAAFPWRAELVKGRAEPDIQGWWSPKYNIKQPSTCAVYSADIKESATFAWVIIPGKGTVPPAKAEIVDADDGAATVRVEREGEKAATLTVPLAGAEARVE